MRDIKMTELLKQLAKLTLEDAPKDQIVTKALEVKLYLQETWEELGRAVNLVDSTISAYAPNVDWQLGIPVDKTKLAIPTSKPLPSTTSPKLTRTSPEHILKVTRRLFPDGVVGSEVIIAQLKAEGDTRPDADIAKSVGNTLNRNGYERIERGKYELTKR
jgi:hypothetical protein